MGLIESAKNLISFLKSEEIQKVAKADFTSIIAANLTNDPAGNVAAIKKTITDVAHLPTYLFWNKMERYLRGTFHCFEDQIKMADRFDQNTETYAKFVVNIISIVDKIEVDEKIDYFANLTRAFLLGCIKSEQLFYKLSKFLLLCTYDELRYLQEMDYTFVSGNTVMISALYQFGLFVQGDTTDKLTQYKLSEFAKALKQNSLNFYNELHGEKRIGDYQDMSPIDIPEPANMEDILKVVDGNLILDAGDSHV